MKLFYIVKGSKIYTDLRNQTAPSQRPFRLIGVVKETRKPSKWIDKSEHWHWVLEYRYTDKSHLQEGFNIEIDYVDNFFTFEKIDTLSIEEDRINFTTNEERLEAKKREKKQEFILNYHEDLKNTLWINKRKEILIRDKSSCKLCNSKKYLHIHHMLYKENKKAWEYDNNDLITLCLNCHEKEHKVYGTGNFKRALELKNLL